jgi:hypothetical protein
MEKGRRKLLEKVPTRKLLASIKRDLRQILKEKAASAKPRKK